MVDWGAVKFIKHGVEVHRWTHARLDVPTTTESRGGPCGGSGWSGTSQVSWGGTWTLAPAGHARAAQNWPAPPREQTPQLLLRRRRVPGVRPRSSPPPLSYGWDCSTSGGGAAAPTAGLVPDLRPPSSSRRILCRLFFPSRRGPPLAAVTACKTMCFLFSHPPLAPPTHPKSAVPSYRWLLAFPACLVFRHG